MVKKICLFCVFFLALSSFADAKKKLCPDGYKVTVNVGSKIPLPFCLKITYAPPIVHHSMKCSAGQFRDPRKGGECWSCPAGYPRFTHPVSGGKACAKLLRPLKYEYKKATFHRSLKCTGNGQFIASRNGGECWSCPSGYRQVEYSLSANRACLKKETRPVFK